MNHADLGDDLRKAVRNLRHRPAFSALVIATLALGIGANVAIFSVVNGVLLTPLPYAEPERLVAIRAELTAQGSSPPSSPPELADIERDVPSLAGLGGIWYRPAALTDDAAAPEDIEMAFVSAGLLPTFGVPALLGRHPLPEEDSDGNDRVIVLSEDLWRRRYGADPEIIGRRVEMDDQLHTVVGVMPRGFRVHLPADVGAAGRVDAWVTFGGAYYEYRRGFRIFSLIGRLGPGATPSDLAAELAAVAEAARAGYADYAGTGYALRAEPLDHSVVATARPLLLTLLGAVGLVLVIVCANVANLFLARSAEMRRDMRIREALGATRARLLRALVLECGVITGIGAAGGIAVAYGAMGLLPLLAPADLPRIDQVALDARVLGFATLIAAGTALSFALLSGIEIRRDAGATALRAGARSVGTRAGGRTRNALLVAELALSLTLLIGVGLMVRSFDKLARVDPGFEPDGVVTIKMSLLDTHFPYREPRRIADFYDQVSRQVTALPGVEAAGITTYLPTLDQSLSPYAFETTEGATEWGATVADRRHVTPGWMEAMGVELLAGRFFDGSDDLDHPNVVIVDEKLAARAWPDDDPIGQRLRVEVFIDAVQTPVWAEVVGLVRHLRHDPAFEGIEQVFIPHAQSPMRTTVLTMRVAGDGAGLGEQVAAIVRQFDGDQPVGVALPMSEYVDATAASRRFALTLLALFAALALALAVIGTYGVIAYGVAQRTREIGIQMAIGASPGTVVRAIVLSGARLAVVGVVLGIAGAAAMARLLSGLLYEVAPTDPTTFATVAAAMALVTMIACWLPARRAARLEPTLALRNP